MPDSNFIDYAKLVDESKRKAVNLIPKLLRIRNMDNSTPTVVKIHDVDKDYINWIEE